MNALFHTVDTLVRLVKDLLDNHKLNCAMLGKFQNDNLEARFGQYIMFSGTNYLVSVKDLIQGEIKMNVKSLLKLYTKSKGVIEIKEFLGKFNYHCKAKCDTKCVDSFPYNTVTNKMSNHVLSSLLYTSGYVARKAMNNTACTECTDLFGNKHNTMHLQVEQEHLNTRNVLIMED